VCNKPVPHGAIAMGTEVERSMNVTFNLCVFVCDLQQNQLAQVSVKLEIILYICKYVSAMGSAR
jgi:hypothetical protein